MAVPDQMTDDIARFQIFAEATRDHGLWVPRDGVDGISAVGIYAMSLLDHFGALDCTTLARLMPESGTRQNVIGHLAKPKQEKLVRKPEKTGREQPYILTDLGRKWLLTTRRALAARRLARPADLAA